MLFNKVKMHLFSIFTFVLRATSILWGWGDMKKSKMMVMMMMFMEKLQAIGIDDKMKNYVGPVRSQLMTRPAVEVLTKIFLSFKK